MIRINIILKWYNTIASRCDVVRWYKMIRYDMKKIIWYKTMQYDYEMIHNYMIWDNTMWLQNDTIRYDTKRQYDTIWFVMYHFLNSTLLLLWLSVPQESLVGWKEEKKSKKKREGEGL